MIRWFLPHPRTLAVVAVTGATLLSACGTAFDAPAAIVAGTEISQAQVKHELDVLLKQPQFAQQVQGPAGAERKREFTRQLLALLIEQNVIARYAKAQRITVTPTELETTLSSVIQQQGGKKQFDAALARLGLTLDEVTENIRLSLVARKVKQAVAQAEFGPNATQQQQDQAFRAWETQQYRAGGVRVNPRFGRFDPSKGSICRIDSTAATTTCAA